MTDAAWKPRLIALDVDGTLLDPATQEVSAVVKAAVRSAVEAGAQVVVSTGRSLLGTAPILDELGLTSGVALCSNGAVLVDAATREALSVQTFEPAPVLAELARRLPGAIFATEALGVGSLVTTKFHEHQLHGPQQLATLDELVSGPVPRLIANWVDHEPAEVVDELTGVRLPHCTFTLDHYEPWVTVVPEGVTKGAALEKVRTEFGIAREDTFAAGDGDNDIEMLRWAAHGVAMGQAPETVRAAADEVTGTVTEDGLAAALNRLFR
ncbi:HAD hydrolase family protein [Saccharopolyspora phatthalungensis]|uniref:Hydroxymethylpyrimidine pyrophosphatase-like HAD family hydrolase n=1 Tax=Saccharopolyspora phatthalungensis TaxID=664693 RepID=A0A840Q1K7_9PSEU|nr:HAD hydrolase family protein [Saccharopolyspora phatthalungensis]MBB5154396.1 hydroxymethylpyrimidine pyrophosphatase-like HAD family hydrolase [Saccharopolyspora phatthalungensis]